MPTVITRHARVVTCLSQEEVAPCRDVLVTGLNYTVFQSKLTSTESAIPRSSARGKGPRDAVERYATETGALELEDGEVSMCETTQYAA